MPSFTLLGSRVIRLPFILYSSYPHEILHNWWGNSVYVDYARGNWSEGLTSYLAESITLDGLTQTDLADADHGSFDAAAATVTVSLDPIPAGASTVVTFSTSIAAQGPPSNWQINNQAWVDTPDGPVPSDDPDTDDPDDPTYIQVQPNQVPVLGPLGVSILVTLLALGGLMVLRRR
jgi:hypothetical protein